MDSQWTTTKEWHEENLKEKIRGISKKISIQIGSRKITIITKQRNFQKKIHKTKFTEQRTQKMKMTRIKLKTGSTKHKFLLINKLLTNNNTAKKTNRKQRI